MAASNSRAEQSERVWLEGGSERDWLDGTTTRERRRCEATWGIFGPVQCSRKEGHDGMHSGMTEKGRIVW